MSLLENGSKLSHIKELAICQKQNQNRLFFHERVAILTGQYM